MWGLIPRMPPYALSDPDVLAFIVIPVILVLVFVWAIAMSSHRSTGSRARAVRDGSIAAAGALLWMSLTWRVASSGVLREWERTPPPFALLVAGILGMAIAVAFSSTGRRLAAQVPVWALVGVQGFRLPLELAMHRLSQRGIIPPQMSYSGLNFDIATGISALVVAALVAAGVAGRRTVIVWNVAGALLLANIVVIALLSTPRVGYFGPDRLNVFVTYPPFVWLAAVMVMAALLGHLLIFRALRASGPLLRLISQQV
jgi:hypothetical protein